MNGKKQESSPWIGHGILFIEGIYIDLSSSQNFAGQKQDVPINGVSDFFGQLFPLVCETFDWLRQIIHANVVYNLLHESTTNKNYDEKEQFGPALLTIWSLCFYPSKLFDCCRVTSIECTSAGLLSGILVRPIHTLLLLEQIDVLLKEKSAICRKVPDFEAHSCFHKLFDRYFASKQFVFVLKNSAVLSSTN